MDLGFQELARSSQCAARRGVFHTAHGSVQTPALCRLGLKPQSRL